jgi:ABC-type dipeptide/oligopeptide/nickel transport system permease component
LVGYALRRLLLLIPVVLGAITILFAAFYVLPGGSNKTAELLAGGGSGRSVPPAILENVKKANGLDKPIYVQYGRYLKRLARGDLGKSYRTNRSVNDMLKQFAPASLRLAFWAIVLEAVLGIGAGILSAVRKYSFADGMVTLLTTLALAIPVFVLGYLLQLTFAVYPNQHDWPQWARLEPQRIGPNSWAFGVIPTGDQWRYLLLPAFALACVGMAVVARLTRSTMLEVGEADYIRTARAKGLAERTVVMKHTLRNALIPVVTLIGLDLGGLIGSAVLTETVFSWPGIGSAIADGARGRDAPVVIGLTVVVIVAYVVVNLIVDLSYALLDPRIRYDSRK